MPHCLKRKVCIFPIVSPSIEDRVTNACSSWRCSVSLAFDSAVKRQDLNQNLIKLLVSHTENGRDRLKEYFLRRFRWLGYLAWEAAAAGEDMVEEDLIYRETLLRLTPDADRKESSCCTWCQRGKFLLDADENPERASRVRVTMHEGFTPGFPSRSQLETGSRNLKINWRKATRTSGAVFVIWLKKRAANGAAAQRAAGHGRE